MDTIPNDSSIPALTTSKENIILCGVALNKKSSVDEQLRSKDLRRDKMKEEQADVKEDVGVDYVVDEKTSQNYNGDEFSYRCRRMMVDKDYLFIQ